MAEYLRATRGTTDRAAVRRPRCGDWSATDGVLDRAPRRRRALGAAGRDRHRLQLLPGSAELAGTGRIRRRGACTRRSTGTPGRSPDATCSSSARATPAPRSPPISPRAERRRVRLAMRTPPNIIPRQLGPVPTTLLAIAMEYSPAWLVDPVNRLLQRAVLGDLTPYGMPARDRGSRGAGARDRRHARRSMSAWSRRCARGAVTPVAALERFDGGEVVLADGTRFAPDAVIAATGYTTGLVPVVGPPRCARRARESARHRPPDAAGRAGTAVRRTLQPAEGSAVPDQARRAGDRAGDREGASR